jgi:hypothetical protein
LRAIAISNAIICYSNAIRRPVSATNTAKIAIMHRNHYYTNAIRLPGSAINTAQDRDQQRNHLLSSHLYSASFALQISINHRDQALG